MKTLTTIFFALGLALSAKAQGHVEAIYDFSGSQVGLQDGTHGYTFRPTQDLAVSDLGVFSYIVNQISPMRVGLWDSSGNLLAERFISGTSSLVGTSYYETLPVPVSLAGQQVYHIGASFTGVPSTFGFTFAGGSLPGHVSSSLGIQLLGYAANSTGFGFPTAVPGAEGTIAVTANFLYPAVPEPSVASLVLLAGVALAAARKRGCR